MAQKNWKDHLLSSGLPLEYSVSRIIEELVNWQPGEFKYERKDPEGIAKVFSVDVHSSHIDTERNFWLEALVECKYRHDGTRWIFTPREYDPLFGRDFNDLFVTLDQCCTDRELNKDFVNKFRSRYPLCGKGIELLPGDANPKTIEQAVQQLRYAVIAKSLNAIVHQVDNLLGTPPPLFVIVPIIVTTSELWRLRPGTTVEDVRRAAEIQDVADTHDIVVLHQAPDNLDKKRTVEVFYETLNDKQIKELDELLEKTMKRTFNFFVDYFASYSPSLYIIIRYERFQSAITNLHEFFAQPRIIKSR
jgi:hypothetical protein